MRIALIHYWLVTMRGGEKVLEALADLYPEADIHTHVYVPEAMSNSINQHTVRTTFINSLPWAKKYYRHYLPLMPLALEQLDLRGYDLVISSESGPAKGVLTDTACTHICYCHTPMRYLWDFYQEYLENSGWFTRLCMRPLTSSLRMWDVATANRVDHFVANSHNVARRIYKHYRRTSTVIHPPVNTSAFAPADNAYPRPEDYYLCFGQLVRYKRVDLAIDACNRLGKKLLVIGEGPEQKRLKSLAGPTVTFAGWMDHARLRQTLQQCKALLFPGEEDFGIVPLEVMAAGRPVIAYGKGGALETVLPGQTGLLFAEQSVESLVQAITEFERIQNEFNPTQLTRHSLAFSPERFTAAFAAFVEEALARKTSETSGETCA